MGHHLLPLRPWGSTSGIEAKAFPQRQGRRTSNDQGPRALPRITIGPDGSRIHGRWRVRLRVVWMPDYRTSVGGGRISRTSQAQTPPPAVCAAAEGAGTPPIHPIQGHHFPLRDRTFASRTRAGVLAYTTPRRALSRKMSHRATPPRSEGARVARRRAALGAARAPSKYDMVDHVGLGPKPEGTRRHTPNVRAQVRRGPA